MSQENIYELYLNQRPLPEGEKYVSRASKAELEFDRGQLETLNNDPDIEKFDKDGFVGYNFNRNASGANVDFHNTSLVIKKTELSRTDGLVVPKQG